MKLTKLMFIHNSVVKLFYVGSIEDNIALRQIPPQRINLSGKNNIVIFLGWCNNYLIKRWYRGEKCKVYRELQI